ncbi:MAG: hypothetical protein K2M52_04870 [Paramuribaculum sp.]|nr:hypothetical protein [Paramuribaculum sp.]
MKINKLLALIVSMAALGAHAQNSVSPYSRFGYGLLRDNATSAQRQMGGVGYAMHNGRQINVMNPASYSHVDSLTFIFDMGLDVSFIHSKDVSGSLNQKGGGLDYITMQFPLSKRIGGSIGLLPYSSVGYSFGSEIKNGSSSYQGSGGLSQLYVGVAGNIIDGLSVGMNISYLFGNNLKDVYATTTAGSTSLFEQELEVRDWHMNFGVQYAYKLSNDRSIGVGVAYSPGKDLLGRARVVKYDVSTNEKPDTVQSIRMQHNFSLADSWGFGINYTNGTRWMAEADMTYQPWSKAKFATMADFPATKFIDRYRFGVGGWYRPKDRGAYYEVMTYRLGAYYTRDYIQVAGNSVREYGVSCGFGFPTLSTKTIINLGVEYRHRRANPNPLLTENYVCITFGVNFNDLWFFKRKID